MTKIALSADVHASAQIGAETSIWHLAQVRELAEIGEGCTIGRGAYVGTGVRVGRHCKLQNYALVYEPTVLEDGVFVGPGAVLTNDQYPRAITPDDRLKSASDWDAVGVFVRHGASIGAGALCIAPIEIGRWAMVAAGSVVVRNVPAFALVAGSPARRVRWVGKAGVPLTMEGTGSWRCPHTSARYVESDDQLVEAA